MLVLLHFLVFVVVGDRDPFFSLFLLEHRSQYVTQTVAGDFTRNRKQVVNRLKIPQGLSTLLFRRWSEVPSRGGVRGDSP